MQYLHRNPATNDLCGECPHQEVATGSWEMNDTGMYAGDCFIFYLLKKLKKWYTSMSAFPVLKDASGILVEAALLTVKDEKY